MSQQRNKLSLADRVKVLEALQNSTSSLSPVAAQFHISKSQAGRISKNRDAILAAFSTYVDMDQNEPTVSELTDVEIVGAATKATGEDMSDDESSVIQDEIVYNVPTS
ncbi:UNVERIFIED_CONTAM: hypothetical protein FKN15_028468 [Acipenser sinensis]